MLRSLLYRIDRLLGTLKPENPWLTRGAIQFLEAELRPTHRVFEWGSGRSTVYFAHRCAGVVSIEHDSTWNALVRQNISKRNLLNVRLEFLERKDPRYASVILENDARYDWILVDGRKRSACLHAALERLADGGIILIDNSDREEICNFLKKLDPTAWEVRHFPSLISCTTALYQRGRAPSAPA